MKRQANFADKAILILIATLAATSCGAGIWFAAQPQTGMFLVPGAVDVLVTDLGPGQRLITYRMQQPEVGWNSTLARRLKDSGWIPPDAFYEWGSTQTNNNVYTRRVSFLGVELWEQARLEGNPREARITVRRWVTYS